MSVITDNISRAERDARYLTFRHQGIVPPNELEISYCYVSFCAVEWSRNLLTKDVVNRWIEIPFLSMEFGEEKTENVRLPQESLDLLPRKLSNDVVSIPLSLFWSVLKGQLDLR